MLLTATVFLPLAGAAVVLLLLGDNARRVRLFAAAVGVADFLLAILVFARYDRDAGGFQLADRLASWIPQLDIQYHLAVDGLSAPLVLLTGLLGLAAIYSSWSIGTRHREYFAWLLTLQTAVMGVFMAQDFVLFFIFWELELIPMFFLISIWGSGRKEHSAMKFLLFTFTGSAFMFVGLLTVYFSTGTFDMTQLVNMDLSDLLLPSQLVFALFFIAFAVKLPVWPVHTWLPDAHTDAPTAVSVMLAGVLLKMGGYGLIRVNVSMFPDVTASASTAIAVLAVISILYGAFVTFRQTDLKRLVANSSISHMGFVLLGISSVGAASEHISPLGLTGAAMQLFSHGVVTGLLFVMVGVVYDKAHTRHIPDLGGLGGPHALRGRGVPRGGAGVAGAARDERFRRRDHGLPWRVPRPRRPDGHRDVRRVDGRGLRAVDAAAQPLRAAPRAMGAPDGRLGGGGRRAGAAHGGDFRGGRVPRAALGRLLDGHQ